MADEIVENADVTPEERQEAEAMGWSDREHWRGAEDQWVDAKTFLERGRSVMPMLKKNNERLLSKVGELSGQLSSLQAAVQAANTTIEVLQESHEADVQEQVKAVRDALKTEIARASREGDHNALADATVKLNELNVVAAGSGEEEKAKLKKQQEEQRRANPVVHPEVAAWYEQNPEYHIKGSAPNVRKIALANAVAAELRAGGDRSVGAEFLNKVADEVEKTLGGKGAGGNSRVAGGNGGSGRGNGGEGGGKTYADLPAEAKTACEKMASRLVGPTRAHKDVKSWRDSYTKQYFKEQ